MISDAKKDAMTVIVLVYHGVPLNREKYHLKNLRVVFRQIFITFFVIFSIGVNILGVFLLCKFNKN